MGRTSNARERLISAAIDLIWSRNYGAVSVDAICDRAEVKKGSFYYFFRSKSDLAVAALEDLWRQTRERSDAVFSSTVPPLERIKNFFGSVFTGQALCARRRGRALGCPIFALGAETCTQDEKIGAKVSELLGRMAKYMETAIRDGIASGDIEDCDPVLLAGGLLALYEGSLTWARISGSPELLRRLPELAMALLPVKPTITVP